MPPTTSYVRSLIFEHGCAQLPIIGNSMYPTLQSGTVATVTPLTNAPLRIGHCYVFLHEGVLVAHRLIRRTAKACYFAGDNNLSVELVGTSTIVGEVTIEENWIKKNVITGITTLGILFRKNNLFKLKILVVRSLGKLFR